MTHIVVEELRLVIDRRTVLDGISFEVAAGESVAMIGPNGSGKTSVLRCLLGLVPFEGRVTIDGHDVRRDPRAAKARIAYLPQRPAFGDGTAGEVVRFFARLRRVDRARAAQVLDEVGLAPHADRRVRTFSGGMQQRLALAIALLDEAPILLLDEPTASLDREGQRAFERTIARFREAGRTILLASHRDVEIARLCDRTITLDEGRPVPLPLGAVAEEAVQP